MAYHQSRNRFNILGIPLLLLKWNCTLSLWKELYGIAPEASYEESLSGSDDLTKLLINDRTLQVVWDVWNNSNTYMLQLQLYL